MMRTISRKFLLCAPFAVAVLLCGCLLGLAGCQSGPSAEELITQDLEEQLGAVRDTDSELYAEFEKDAKAQLENGNKAAGTRARKASLELTNLLKEFRKASIEFSK